MRSNRKKLSHKINRDRYRKLTDSPYWLKPGAVFQFPGSRYGVVNESDYPMPITPIWFDTPAENQDNPSTT